MSAPHRQPQGKFWPAAKRLAALVLVLGTMATVGAALPLASSRAGSWVFRPSYYSHHPAYPVQVGIRVSQRPGYHYAEYYRTGYYLKNTSRSLRTPNQYFYAEGWIQHRWGQ